MDSVKIFKSGLDALMESFRVWLTRLFETIFTGLMNPYILIAVLLVAVVFIVIAIKMKKSN